MEPWEQMMTKPAHILIVDDVKDNRDILAKLVTRLGHLPILAEGGLVALEKLREQPVDLVLLDIMMPEIDGYKVLSDIKDDVSLMHIPVIMITAIDETQSAVDCIKMGADDYLTKPVNRVLLKARIGACLEKKSLYDREKEYLSRIKEYNLRLTELIHKQTQELAAANDRLQILNKAKGNALKLIYYDFQNSLRSLVKKPLDEAHKLLDEMKQHILPLIDIDPNTMMLVFELNTVRAILQSAIELASEFAQSRHVLIGSMPDCGGQSLEPSVTVAVETEYNNDFDEVFSVLPVPVTPDDEQYTRQKELCANALAKLIKTAIEFSRPGGTVNLSCKPLQSEIYIGLHAVGKTIPEEDLPQFFEDPSDKEKNPRRHPGLEPSMAQNIITLLGGSVTVKNRDSTGISLVVKLKRDSLVNT